LGHCFFVAIKSWNFAGFMEGDTATHADKEEGGKSVSGEGEGTEPDEEEDDEVWTEAEEGDAGWAVAEDGESGE
jgi:hypothetical protein